jgi:hypothetical protein
VQQCHFVHVLFRACSTNLTCLQSSIQNLDSCVWKFRLDGFQNQKHRATKQSSGQEARRRPNPAVSAALDATLSVEEGKNVDTVASLAKRRKLPQGFSSFHVVASAAAAGAGAAGAAVAQSTSLDGHVAASLNLGSMLDAESAHPARKRPGSCVNPSTTPLPAGSIHDGAARQIESKALVKEALQSVRESLNTSTEAHGTLDSDEVTMFGEFAAHFTHLLPELRQNYHPVGSLLSRAALVLDSVRANYTDLGDIRMRRCNRLPPAPSLLPSSLPFWLPSLSSPFRSLADRFRRQHPI